LASIDAFLDFAACEPAPARVPRASLRRLPVVASPTTRRRDTRERALFLAAVVLVHLLLLLALRAAMKPPAASRVETTEPFVITIITPQAKTVVVPPALQPFTPRKVLRSDALQAVTVAPHSESTTPSGGDAPPAWWHEPDAGPRISQTQELPRRVPWERPRASNLLPGVDSRGNAPEVHPGLTPQQKVEIVGAFLFGGGHDDPCPRIKQQMVDLEDADVRAEAEEHYERSCEGR
jgi:hypothetical protein